jgi:hypothetical protein
LLGLPDPRENEPSIQQPFSRMPVFFAGFLPISLASFLDQFPWPISLGMTMRRTLPEVGDRTSLHQLPRMLLVVMLSFAAWPSQLWAQKCDAGVNVNSFQNFDAAQQESIVQQLVSSGVHCVRTSLRPDDKNLHLAKNFRIRASDWF